MLSPAGAPAERLRVATERERGYQHIVDLVVGLARRLVAVAPDAPCVGLATPGARSLQDGTLRNSNTTCLNGMPLFDDVATGLDRPLVMENDANCFALAEARHGAGREHRMVFGVILGTGVGGGIVVDGRLWPGAQHVAGEWGHHRIDPAGPECYCGRRGCVETYLAGPALERAYAAATGEPAEAVTVVARASAGERAARTVLDAWLDVFGRALGNVVNVLDPDVVVLGGGLSNVGALYEQGAAAVRDHVFSDAPRVRIARNALGDSSGVIGAALLDP